MGYIEYKKDLVLRSLKELNNYSRNHFPWSIYEEFYSFYEETIKYLQGYAEYEKEEYLYQLFNEFPFLDRDSFDFFVGNRRRKSNIFEAILSLFKSDSYTGSQINYNKKSDDFFNDLFKVTKRALESIKNPGIEEFYKMAEKKNRP